MEKMRISVGSDHRGFHVKQKILELLAHLGHETTDVGVSSTDSADYPDVAAIVGQQVSGGDADRGILVCGTGLGIAWTKLASSTNASVHVESLATLSFSAS